QPLRRFRAVEAAVRAGDLGTLARPAGGAADRRRRAAAGAAAAPGGLRAAAAQPRGAPASRPSPRRGGSVMLWVAIAGLTLVVLGAVLWPLLRPRKPPPARALFDRRIYSEQLAE